MKIAVIGYSGSGKSTAAGEMAECFGVPVLYIDSVNFLPGWVQRDRREVNDAVSSFMQSNGSWVIDGNYFHQCFERRMEQADMIVFFDFPPLVCLKNAIVRRIRYSGRVRPSAAPGCPERMDAQFVHWILFGGRTKEKRLRYKAVAEMYEDKTFVLKNRRQANAFLERQRALARKQ